MKDDRLLQLGQKIRYERLKRKFSQEDLEEKSSVSRRTISEIERGNADIRYTNLYQIAEAFGLKISELLDFKL
ncbi:MAG: helix-turn-helix transcriptional regulator [Candidatus Gastranaerophilaceae bacterium]|jgi:transcriptional regulator with XRE-family HTH domain|nr:XRE family transcriptional regulator [bacterium]MEE0495013.1 helix-turn-helix transcriptional regulator [Cyanobacteriota bacterium]CDE93323.1 xRE family transcriptional regulator [Fusobacterium sp. CAG:815]DAA92262.1 MAG TPA: XRE family transcriptional regulator [Candidatus Gastranaerophilales bacterium HUM_6]DAA92662.1 MAG TPA: XRE family transcriptional regulator [Candidatus Gastranaerophilales bacterium HUM_7]DAB01272.1 MAG TPA: XRE family transcriptional regulator [Candidatus Gastranaer